MEVFLVVVIFALKVVLDVVLTLEAVHIVVFNNILKDVLIVVLIVVFDVVLDTVHDDVLVIPFEDTVVALWSFNVDLRIYQLQQQHNEFNGGVW